ncbi:hypothetical protein IAR55_001635 [Kwoniella newhampshirensis]|uniref:Uncharacterized protein n=1 Tax=Kwoniella newhampshirensis TaxID=1651941 RepID=A0AAW0Z2P3_9TREE
MFSKIHLTVLFLAFPSLVSAASIPLIPSGDGMLVDRRDTLSNSQRLRSSLLPEQPSRAVDGSALLVSDSECRRIASRTRPSKS